MQNNKNDAPLSDYLYCGLIVIVVATFCLFLPNAANAFSIKNHIAALGIVLLLLLYLLFNVNTTARIDIVLPKSWPGLGLALWIFAFLCSGLNAQNTALSWQYFLNYCPFFLLILLLFNLAISTAQLRKFEVWILITTFVIALIAIAQALVPGFSQLGFQAEGKMKVYATLGNPHWVAIILVAGLPLTLHVLVDYIKPIKPASFFSMALMLIPLTIVVAILCTQSKQGLIALVVMGIVYGLSYVTQIHKKRLVLGSLIGFALLLLVIATHLDYFHTLKGRFLISNAAIRMVLDYPLGIGMGYFEVLYPDYQAKVLALKSWSAYQDQAAYISDAHNEWLQWGVTTGWLGMLGLGIFCFSLLWNGWRSENVQKYIPQWYLSFVGILVMLSMTSIQMQAAPSLIFIISASLIMKFGEVGVIAVRCKTFGKVIAIILMLMLGGLLVNLAIKDLTANSLEGSGDVAFEEHDDWLAGIQYQQAIEINPLQTSAYLKLAPILFLQSRHSEALSMLSKVEQLSGDTSIRILQGEIYTSTNELNKAIAVYKTLTQQFPNMVSPHFILGQLYIKQQQWFLARMELERVLAIKPSNTNLQMTKEKISVQKKWAIYYLQNM